MRAPETVLIDRSPISRELSTLAFNRRVLALAQDASIPLLERLRFLTIVASNLDEFFEIRVAGLMGHLRSKMPPPGVTLGELRSQYAQIAAAAHALVADQYVCLNAQVLPALAGHGVRLLRRSELTAAQRQWAATMFR
ncbi:MAG TPA: RNA degradosome polyphosphate kinase, partial [Casimicrobiaceae bacterium]|nr:RNA degradosome polyphosphate kinase [Casimicrobiaceae bacterium]